MQPERLLVLLAAATACGPSTVEDTELRELCGEDGPVRVLELPADARPFASAKVSRLDEDHLLWQLFSAAPDSEGHPEPSLAWGVFITGTCGESPERIPDVVSARLDANLPGLLLTSAGTRPYDISVIDPNAPAEQHLLFAGVGWSMGPSKHGFLSVDDEGDEISSLSFRPYPADPFSGPATAITLAQLDADLDEHDGLSDALARVEVVEDAVWVVTTDDELVRISLPDGNEAVEQVGVRSFALSEGERWLVWEDLAVLGHGRSGEPLGRSHLRDRGDGSERELWIGRALPWTTQTVANHVIYSPNGWLHVDDLSPLELPEHRELDGPFGEQQHWFTTRYARPPVVGEDPEPAGFARFDIVTGTETPLYDHPARVIDRRGDGLELMHGVDLRSPPAPTEVPLWFAPFDGSPPRRLAHAATAAYLRMPDGRIVTPLHFDADRRATLMLVDPDTLETSRIDDHVFIEERMMSADPEIWGDDVVLYSVADGDRSGMWIARLPER